VYSLEPNEDHLCGADLKCFSGYCSSQQEVMSSEYTWKMHQELQAANNQSATLNFG
jgi:hypothetical protein